MLLCLYEFPSNRSRSHEVHVSLDTISANRTASLPSTMLAITQLCGPAVSVSQFSFQGNWRTTILTFGRRMHVDWQRGYQI